MSRPNMYPWDKLRKVGDYFIISEKMKPYNYMSAIVSQKNSKAKNNPTIMRRYSCTQIEIGTIVVLVDTGERIPRHDYELSPGVYVCNDTFLYEEKVFEWEKNNDEWLNDWKEKFLEETDVVKLGTLMFKKMKFDATRELSRPQEKMSLENHTEINFIDNVMPEDQYDLTTPQKVELMTNEDKQANLPWWWEDDKFITNPRVMDSEDVQKVVDGEFNPDRNAPYPEKYNLDEFLFIKEDEEYEYDGPDEGLDPANEEESSIEFSKHTSDL